MAAVTHCDPSEVESLPRSSAPAAPQCEELLRAFPAIELDVCGSRGVGALHVTTRRVVWISAPSGGGESAGRSAPGYGFAFPAITLHSVCRDVLESGVERECIYCQIDVPSAECACETVRELLDSADAELEDEEADEEDATTTIEVRFIPSAASNAAALLRDIFHAMSKGAALNPCTDNDGSGSALGFGGLFSGSGGMFGCGEFSDAVREPVSEAVGWDPAVMAAMAVGCDEGDARDARDARDDPPLPTAEERAAMLARLDALVDDSAVKGRAKFVAAQFSDAKAEAEREADAGAST